MSGDSGQGWSRIAVGLVAALATLATLYLGCVDRDTTYVLFDLDTQAWYVGGVAWLRGESAYELAAFQRAWSERFGGSPAGFVFGPTMLPLSVLLGALPWDVARWTMRAINLACFFGSWVVLRDVLAVVAPARATAWQRRLSLALALGLPVAALTLYQGQASLLVLFGLCLLWSGLARGRAGPLVVGFVIASFKPQVSLLPILFLVALYRDPKMWWGLATATALGALVLLWSGPRLLLEQFAESLGAHRQLEFNELQNYDSVPALLGWTRVGGVAAASGVLVGVGLALWLGGRARRAPEREVQLRLLQLCVAATSATMPIHRYDLTIDMFLLATAWAVGSTRRAAVFVVLVFAHGRAFWLGGRLRGSLLPELSVLEFRSLLASLLGAAVLAFLAACWFRDRQRLRPG